MKDSKTKMKDSNKLIAEFMGYESYEYRGYRMFILEEDNHRTDVDLHYHTSWDWLMPIIERCLVGEAEQSEEVSNTSIKNIYESICNQDIHFAYKSVVEFIKQQNK
jgi:hypothetical protein